MDYYCYVQFEPKDDASLRRLTQFFEMIKAAKESEAPAEKEPHLIEYLSDAERSYFYNPSEAELEEWKNDWFSTPLPRRHSDETLVPRWQLESMLQIFWDGDYELIGVLQKGAHHFVCFNPYGYPYGGTASFIALVECFGHRVIGVDDGAGYRVYSPRTTFWQPRASRGL